jgi:subtilisin
MESGEQDPQHEGQTTGRSVVVFADGARGDSAAITAALRSVAGAGTDTISFKALGVAVVAVDPAALTAAIATDAAPSGSILAVEPERIMHAIAVEEPAAAARFADDDEFTWGLRATGVDATSATGSAIRVAILDTGLDAEHPDFAGRAITARSFVSRLTADDGQGHGTHCTGTACGPADPPQGRRYAIATQAEIFAGKVLDNSGAGTDASILAGIDWAITNGCHVISMSLGADVRTVSAVYETVGRRALAAGTLIVAAAGNNARRADGLLGFVGMPANSPSIMAVAAVDADLAIADFSAASNPVEGGQIDIAGPGVDVYSAWPLPRRTNTISGTSMATPHVAGIAALLSQQTGTRAQALWDALVDGAQALDLPASDVGAGLVRAPC